MTENKETAEQQSEVAHTHDHAHDHDHDHEHQHAPSLNPELMREIEVEAPAEEVSKSFKTVVKRYQKLARIPGFRAGKVPESLIRSKFAKEVRQEVLEAWSRNGSARRSTSRSCSRSPSRNCWTATDRRAAAEFKAAFEVAAGVRRCRLRRGSRGKARSRTDRRRVRGELNRVLDSHATVETVEEDRALVDGDWAEIEFRGEVQDLAQTVTEEGVANTSQKRAHHRRGRPRRDRRQEHLPAFNEALRGRRPARS